MEEAGRQAGRHEGRKTRRQTEEKSGQKMFTGTELEAELFAIMPSGGREINLAETNNNTHLVAAGNTRHTTPPPHPASLLPILCDPTPHT